MTTFSHLHVHTQFSLLDGAASIPALFKKAAADGQPAIAITDHGNMFGTIQHYKACKEQGMQAILGCEINVARPRAEGSHGKAGEDPVEHLVLLAASEEGYKNLVRIVSRGAKVFTSKTRAPLLLFVETVSEEDLRNLIPDLSKDLSYLRTRFNLDAPDPVSGGK